MQSKKSQTFVILSLLQKSDQAACKAQAAAKKSKENLRHTLNLWILRYAQYDKAKTLRILLQDTEKCYIKTKIHFQKV